jgi:enoyl-CoA hydratase
MTDEVSFDQKKHLGLITLTRPHALNALTLSMITAIQDQLSVWRLDDSIHAVVIQGEGEKAFCAGGDVRWLYEKGRQHHTELMQFFWHEYRLNHYIHDYPKPYIALLNGITMGGGVGVSLHGSHPIASERFKFAMPETSIGLFPDVGASYLLSHCPGELGTYLGLTGSRLNADEAFFCNLVKAIVPSERFSELVTALTEADLTTDAFKSVDECVQRFSTTPAKAAAIHAHLHTINTCFSAHTMEDILADLAHSQSEWANTLGVALLAKSPLSLKVTLLQLQRAKSKSMTECIKMDYTLVEHFMTDFDFYEGVRALLIDKDQSPQWQPSTLAEVNDPKVMSYFERTQGDLNLID